MRPSCLRVALALTLIAAPLAAAAPDLTRTYEDARDDVVRQDGSDFGARVDAPGLDIVRLETATTDARLVARIHLAAAPSDDLIVGVTVYPSDVIWRSLGLRADFTPSGTTTEGREDDMERTRQFPVEVVVDGTTIELSMALADLPADMTCFEARAQTASIGERGGTIGDHAGNENAGMPGEGCGGGTGEADETEPNVAFEEEGQEEQALDEAPDRETPSVGVALLLTLLVLVANARRR